MFSVQVCRGRAWCLVCREGGVVFSVPMAGTTWTQSWIFPGPSLQLTNSA